MLKTRRRSHVSGSVRPSLFTPASRLQKDSGWNCKVTTRMCQCRLRALDGSASLTVWIWSWRSTQKPSVGVWQGP